MQLRRAGFRVTRTIDLSPLEARGEFLEGTGSLVLDRCHRIAYACRSPRTTPAALADFAARARLPRRRLRRAGPEARPIYHTNVMMAIGARFAVALRRCDPGRRRARGGAARARASRPRADRASASREMNGFAGNLLALSAGDGRPLIAMSDAAWDCLAASERRALERHGAIVTAPIPTIERLRRRQRALHDRRGFPAALSALRPVIESAPTLREALPCWNSA